MDKINHALQLYDRTPDFNIKHKNGYMMVDYSNKNLIIK